MRSRALNFIIGNLNFLAPPPKKNASIPILQNHVITTIIEDFNRGDNNLAVFLKDLTTSTQNSKNSKH